ncbi:putative abortive infection bacteriophage resistance protein [Fusobacterium varium]|nr:putative abortive infection bacteriophage resistance protein [Fusobacterium varium]
MCIIYDKPFMTYDELIKQLIEKRELEILNKEQAIQWLKAFSYYDLITGTKECFRNGDKYKKNVTLEKIIDFNFFDKNFQNILFKYSVYVENIYKTNISYLISKNYGVHQDKYLKKSNFNYNSLNEWKLNEVLSNIKNSISTNDQPTKHYNDNHNHIPAWILFKNVRFTDVIDLFIYLQYGEKIEITDEYIKERVISNKDKIELMRASLTIVRKFRNKIAHNSKVITYRSEKNAELHQDTILKIFPSFFVTKNDKNKKRGRNDLFAMIISLIILLKENFFIKNMLLELIALVENFEEVASDYLEVTKLPRNLKERMEKLFELYK